MIALALRALGGRRCAITASIALVAGLVFPRCASADTLDPYITKLQFSNPDVYIAGPSLTPGFGQNVMLAAADYHTYSDAKPNYRGRLSDPSVYYYFMNTGHWYFNTIMYVNSDWGASFGAARTMPHRITEGINQQYWVNRWNWLWCVTSQGTITHWCSMESGRLAQWALIYVNAGHPETDQRPQHMATHEMGHAFVLTHRDPGPFGEYWCNDSSVMWGGFCWSRNRAGVPDWLGWKDIEILNSFF